MIKNSIISLLTLIIMTSCLSTSNKEMYEYNALVYDKDPELESVVMIPDVEFFISASYDDSSKEESLVINEVEIPVEIIPQKNIEEEESFIEVSSPAETAAVESDVKDIETLQISGEPENLTEIIEDNPVETEPQIVSELELPVEQHMVTENPVEKVPETPVIETQKIFKEIQGLSGNEFTIELDNEGWIYEGADSPAVKMKRREFSGDKTRFLFSIEEPGDFQLSFYLQNLQSGEAAEAEYSVKMALPSQYEDQPIIIEPDLEDNIEAHYNETEDDIIAAVEEENIPEIVASFDQLLSEEEPVGSSVFADVFALLEKNGGYDQLMLALAEKVFVLYPYDNLSAELLYKAALTMEKPGPGQNIKKAVNLFKIVRDHFPISIYCDKSEERIRYLERHFMKIY